MLQQLHVGTPDTLGGMDSKLSGSTLGVTRGSGDWGILRLAI